MDIFSNESQAQSPRGGQPNIPNNVDPRDVLAAILNRFNIPANHPQIRDQLEGQLEGLVSEPRRLDSRDPRRLGPAQDPKRLKP